MAHGTSIGMGHGKPHSLLPAALGSGWLIHELHLQLVAFSTPLPSPALIYPFSSSISQPPALPTLHPSPVPSVLHYYSRWPENGTAIKTNSLDQVLHFSLSEQPGRMKGDKDDCKHHPCHPMKGQERASELQAGWH